MEGTRKTNFSRLLKQFDGLTWLIMTPTPLFYDRSKPMIMTTDFSRRAFHFSAPPAWNSLYTFTNSSRQWFSDSSFNPDLKRFLQSGFHWTLIRPAVSATEIMTVWRYRNSIIMRPSSLAGGCILRRTLSVRLSVRPVNGSSFLIGQRQPCGCVVSFVLFTSAGRILYGRSATHACYYYYYQQLQPS